MADRRHTFICIRNVYKRSNLLHINGPIHNLHTVDNPTEFEIQKNALKNNIIQR